MQTSPITIQPYQKQWHNQMVSVWERSARATHHFVTSIDLDYYKTRVEQIDFTGFPVYCLIDCDKVLGFIGIADAQIETLFLDPDIIGQGFGKMLMDFALTELKADKVDVNEQNTHAVNFYSKFGFEQYGRTGLDPEGKPYPILKMKLKTA
jgi:putative acetyltransferase